SVRQTVATLTAQLSLTIVGVLAVSLMAATALTWLLTRPVISLVAATEAVAKGDFTQRVPRWADDEIGDLSVAFNRMTAELARTDELLRDKEQLRRQLLEGVITAQEDERRRIARELHDSTSQSLTSVMVGLRNLEIICDDPQLHTQVTDMRKVVSQTLDEVHNLAMQLRPAALDDLGLEAALERLVDEWKKRHAIKTDMVINIGKQRLPGVIETAVYRIVQEALTNVSRHAHAKGASVLINRRGSEIVAIVEDNGRGFDITQAKKNDRLGLLGIQERADLLGGRITVESSPEKGTSLFIYLPVPPPPDNESLPNE
ncbi:MAG: HAMP domain-containing protein, partial [Anaerolineales bacterium]